MNKPDGGDFENISRSSPDLRQIATYPGPVITEAPISKADAARLRMDQPTNLIVITSALWFDEPVAWDRTANCCWTGSSRA
jgi:hypothetical protein